LDNFAACNFDHPPLETSDGAPSTPEEDVLRARYQAKVDGAAKKENSDPSSSIVSSPYPQRPGHETCAKFKKTGRCPAIDGGGSCRFDHPVKGMREGGEDEGAVSVSVRAAMGPQFNQNSKVCARLGH